MLDRTMCDRLLEVCEREFTAHVSMLLDINRLTSIDGCARVPYIDELYGVNGSHPDYDPLKRAVAALLARQKFALDAPLEPMLPLSMRECDTMVADPDPSRALVGLFASSLRGLEWDYDMHPCFERYARGLMAFEPAPCTVRCDPKLRERYPPQRLDGLADDDWCWRTPEKIAEDRQFYAWGKDMKARREAGLPHLAFDDEWRRAHPVST